VQFHLSVELLLALYLLTQGGYLLVKPLVAYDSIDLLFESIAVRPLFVYTSNLFYEILVDCIHIKSKQLNGKISFRSRLCHKILYHIDRIGILIYLLIANGGGGFVSVFQQKKDMVRYRFVNRFEDFRGNFRLVKVNDKNFYLIYRATRANTERPVRQLILPDD
jgi:hypothetical protein